MSCSLATAPEVLHDSCISDRLKRVVARPVRVSTRITAGVVLNARTEKDMVGNLTRGYREGGLTLWEGKIRVRDWTIGKVGPNWKSTGEQRD